jgi:hypothetical protein
VSSLDPIAYTYDADNHCPSCAETRFGRSERGFIAEDSADSEGNPVGVIAPWDEWVSGLDGCETLACGTCLEVIERAHDETVCRAVFGSDECARLECSECFEREAVFRVSGDPLCEQCAADVLEAEGFRSILEALQVSEIERIYPLEPAQSETLF